MSENYSFMRTGIQNDQIQENKILDAAAIVSIFMEDAMKIAEMFTVHSGQNVISKDATIRALKIRAILGETFWQQPGMLQRLEDVKKFLTEKEDCTMEEDEDVTLVETETAWVDPLCQCTLCNTFKEVPLRWNSWQPSNQYDIIIRDAINKTS